MGVKFLQRDGGEALINDRLGDFEHLSGTTVQGLSSNSPGEAI